MPEIIDLTTVPDDRQVFLPVEGADLTLIVGREPSYGLRVSSAMLRLHSSVFRDQLQSFAVDNQPSQDKHQLELPNDDPKAIAVLVNMIHLRFKYVPHSPTLPLLREILAVAKKYDMSDILESKAKDWARFWRSIVGTFHGARPEVASLVYISWELGDKMVFSAVVKRLAWSCRVNDSGHLIDCNKKPLKNYKHLDSGGNLVHMERSRLQRLDTILQECRSLGVKAMSNSPLCSSKTNSRAKRTCHSLKWGRLLQEASRHNLEGIFLHGRDAKTTRISVKGLMRLLDGIGNEIASIGHEKCNPLQETTKKIRDSFKNLPQIGTPDHIRYLEARAKVTGVYLI